MDIIRPQVRSSAIVKTPIAYHAVLAVRFLSLDHLQKLSFSFKFFVSVFSSN